MFEESSKQLFLALVGLTLVKEVCGNGMELDAVPDQIKMSHL